MDKFIKRDDGSYVSITQYTSLKVYSVTRNDVVKWAVGDGTNEDTIVYRDTEELANEVLTSIIEQIGVIEVEEEDA